MTRAEFLLYPGVPRRIKASAVDGVVIGLLVFVGLQVLARLAGKGPVVSGLAIVLPLFFYEPLCLWLRGATVGHTMFELRVVPVSRAGRVSLWRAVLRFLTKAVLGWLSLLLVYSNERRRAVHDIVGATVVVESDTTEEEHLLVIGATEEGPSGPS